jgi:Ca2+-binding RTX toxin-like protein
VRVPDFHLNSDTVVAAGVVLNAAANGGVGYLVDQGTTGPNFTNNGDITFSQAAGQAGATGLELAPGSGINWIGGAVDNEGHFSVTSQGSATFLFGESMPAITNDGTITVSAAGVAEAVHIVQEYQVYVNAVANSVTNAGQITVSGAGSATGLFLGNGAFVTNSGVINVTGAAAGTVVHGIWSAMPTGVINSGQIVAIDNDPNLDSVAVHVGGGSAPIENTGVITGDIAIEDVNSTIDDSQFQSIQNSGVINGRIVIDVNPIANVHVGIANSGTINGDVDLGPGAQSYFGQQGIQNGLISGGEGDDQIFGGAFHDALQGNQGNDTLHGMGGDDIVVGGKDDDLEYGEDGDDIVWGNLGNDTLSGGNGNDQVRGGQGDDSITGGAGDDFISGDRGNDTESGGAGADLFHGSQDAGIDRVLDFNQGEGDRVMLDPGTTYTLSQVGADTIIDMGAGNQMILVGVQLSSLKSGWIFEG